nr:hypothetical protein [Tanacetum cinerariifolium]
MKVSYTPTEKMIQALIHMARSLRTIFKKHKINVIIEGSMEEILKLFEGRGRLAKWETEIRTYDISYVSRKEPEGLLVKKFLGQGEHGLRTSGASGKETISIGKELEANLTLTPNPWHLYIGKEAVKEAFPYVFHLYRISVFLYRYLEGIFVALEDAVELVEVGSGRASFGPNDVVVALSIGEKGNGLVPSSAAGEEAAANSSRV